MFFNNLHKSLIFHLLYIIPTGVFYTYLLNEIYGTDYMQTKGKTEIRTYYIMQPLLCYNTLVIKLGLKTKF